MALFSSLLYKMIQFWNMLDQMCPFQGYFILVTLHHLYDHHHGFLLDPVHLFLFVNTVPFKVSCFDKMDMVWKLMDRVFQLYLWQTSYLTLWPSSSLPPWPCPPATPLNEIGPFEMIGFDNISIIWKVFSEYCSCTWGRLHTWLQCPSRRTSSSLILSSCYSLWKIFYSTKVIWPIMGVV